MTDQIYWQHVADGTELFVRLTPKSSRDAIEGVGSGADGRCYIKAKVRAVPEDGKANKALIKLFSKVLGVPASSITLIAGHTSRLKTLHVAVDDLNIEVLFSGNRTGKK